MIEHTIEANALRRIVRLGKCKMYRYSNAVFLRFSFAFCLLGLRFCFYGVYFFTQNLCLLGFADRLSYHGGVSDLSAALPLRHALLLFQRTFRLAELFLSVNRRTDCGSSSNRRSDGLSKFHISIPSRRHAE